jgi:four helix bundle protein
MAKVESHRDLIVLQKGMALATEAYSLAKQLPKAEEYRLTSQLLRAAAAVPANIAEGHGRGTRKDYAKFISIARGSLAEAETFLMLAVKVRTVVRRGGSAGNGPMRGNQQDADRLADAIAGRPFPVTCPLSPVPSLTYSLFTTEISGASSFFMPWTW